MAERGTISNLARVLYQYRLHRSSISMTKQVDLLRGSAYAKITALQRRSGMPESSFEEFAQLWRKRGVAEVLTERIRLVSNMSYRLARINISEGHRALGALQMAVAAGLDPMVASAHLRRLASSMIVQWRAAGKLTLKQADRAEEDRYRESYEPQGSTKWEPPVPHADELR
jgi:hypothetical protein